MTGPEGERYHGMWRVTALDPPTSLRFTDVFADTDGTPIPDMPAQHGHGPSSSIARRHPDGDAVDV